LARDVSGQSICPYSRVKQSKKNVRNTEPSYVTYRNNEGGKQSVISFFPLDVFHPSALKNYVFRLHVHATGCIAYILLKTLSITRNERRPEERQVAYCCVNSHVTDYFLVIFKMVVPDACVVCPTQFQIQFIFQFIPWHMI